MHRPMRKMTVVQLTRKLVNAREREGAKRLSAFTLMNRALACKGLASEEVIGSAVMAVLNIYGYMSDSVTADVVTVVGGNFLEVIP